MKRQKNRREIHPPAPRFRNKYDMERTGRGGGEGGQQSIKWLLAPTNPYLPQCIKATAGCLRTLILDFFFFYYYFFSLPETQPVLLC